MKKLLYRTDEETVVYDNVLEGLYSLYKTYILELENEFNYYHFYKPLLTSGDFLSKPMILLLGQYSTGKTTFIKHLIEKEYCGMRIGPEPTTDKFVAVMYSEKEQLIPGNALVSDITKPFSQLESFGNSFLSKLECSNTNSDVLKSLTIIDTPGVLSGIKQISRGYDFEKVIYWFAQRVDLILLIFDAHKLDISDEFRRCIQAIKGQDSKIRIILNKADTINTQQLMRVYGSLMWSLGIVINTPEVNRVYIGSFWDRKLMFDENRSIFEDEASDLYKELSKIPRNSTMIRLNDFIKRCRTLKVHIYLLTHLRQKLPYFRKDYIKGRLIKSLEKIYEEVARENNLPLGDFPPVQFMKEKLHDIDWLKIPKLDLKKIEKINKVLNVHIPQLLEMIPKESATIDMTKLGTNEGTIVDNKLTPFLELTSGEIPLWVKQKYLLSPIDTSKYSDDFYKLGPNDYGKISGEQVKPDLIKSKLPSSVLHKIWNLADITKDGYLDLFEYSLARHFIEMKVEGFDLPAKVPKDMLNSHEY
ncbi:EH domain-containing protein, putative [Plasmodium chabaudi chabaudi]|uniref:EH domain-containing protein, putative n=2 Tax=Plasmodium chabaudi TaxID=5825 RepID=A0A077TM09_PLACU|nr:EH domain-containing protein, putative [Plasmodium chabaudi chabaudi]SCM01219.1 EH domain-containing protein, putative [Plasmodium chabaudi adami]SCL98062.1 EH domain-containing protein, putative [Plasmodium chabaudi chabaudi]SCL98589.1 EH domain-containing protein, putative [Plasmodium chabaudi chabaudi]SCM06023.1 EH domain-containing protein, putative [Plasmodium chabaudi adami]VTZ67163.1 EH domain-containing protein, putative [Plasmodium chabaudi chabaudi]|eukprot:XP_739263.2 EH (Eps15 homology) protein, putative [Plasmodium chabaudi chabaudi]